MKTKLLLLVFAIVFTTANLRAADFTVDGIAYTITSATAPYTVAVALKSTGYKGAVTIPDAVNYNSINYSVTSIGNTAFHLCTGLTSVTFPNSVTSIGDVAFAFCNGLTSVIIPNSVTSIGMGAFNSCTGLTSVTIPASVTFIGDIAFPNYVSFYVNSENPNYSSIDEVLYNKVQTSLIQCHVSKKGSFVIPSSVTSIGRNAFDGCTGLTAVTIPNSVTSIGDQAFEGCSGLTSLTIPNSITFIGSEAFNGCTNLTSVILPNSVTSIGAETFYGCTGLISVTIPNSVTTIRVLAFYNCSGLTSLTIPNSITFIGSEAFNGCTNLTSIYADSPIPVDLSNYSTIVFYNVNKTACTLYVPIGSKSLYAAANQWKDFKNIVEHIVTGIATVSASRLNIRVMGRTMEICLPEASAHVQVVDISGRQLYNGTPSGSTLSITLPQAGIYIVRVGNKTTKLVAP
jgi:hypothetical protein